MPENLVPPEVNSFINQCAHEVGKFEEDAHSMNLWNECNDLDIESPIEQMLYCALNTLQKFNYIEDADPIELGGKMFIRGFLITPQKEIGKYRADFELCYSRILHNPLRQEDNKVLVECDSQEFHERTERERRYEKKRDRYFTGMGLKVFHFTGKEIKDHPMETAREIICFLTGIKEDEIQLDSNLED
jgi:very-short-patch-repair endonuclease